MAEYINALHLTVPMVILTALAVLVIGLTITEFKR